VRDLRHEESRLGGRLQALRLGTEVGAWRGSPGPGGGPPTALGLIRPLGLALGDGQDHGDVAATEQRGEAGLGGPTGPRHHLQAELNLAVAPPKSTFRHRDANPKAVINIGGVKHEVGSSYFPIPQTCSSNIQVMWRIFEAKPRTRLGRLSHANTHDDILDLVSI
jgi:hypothetical protein